jgi:phosphonate utilization transcriptional regulator
VTKPGQAFVSMCNLYIVDNMQNTVLNVNRSPNKLQPAMKPTPELQAIEMLQAHSLTSLVQREVERMILAGDISSGAKLNEAEIAARLGVSRGPVREAFRALEETGLVQLEKNRGVFVRQISVHEAHEIYELRAAFDQMAGRKLAAGASAEHLKELRAILDRMEKAAARNDIDAYHSLNMRFHDAVVEFAGNQKLLAAYRRLVNELTLFRRHTLMQRDRLPTSTKEHRKIVDAIAAHDAEAASKLLFEHAMASRDRMHTVFAAAPETVTLAVKEGAGKTRN